MEKNNINSHPSDEDIYHQKISKGKFLGSIILVFFLFLIYNLPLSKNIKRIITTNLTTIPNCPLEIRKIELGIFLPKINIHNLKFLGRCRGLNLGDLEFKKVRAVFLGPSFSPLGIKLQLDTIAHGMNLNLYTSISPSQSIKLKIENSILNTELISKIIKKPIPFTGKVQINSLIDGKMGNKSFKPSNISFKVTSNGLLMPKQTINFLDLPQLMLGPAIISAKTTGSGKSQKMKILQFLIGDKKSDLEVQIEGELRPNFMNFVKSQSNFKGKIRIGKNFTDFVPMNLLNSILLKGAKPQKDFYTFRLDGPLETTKPKFQ